MSEIFRKNILTVINNNPPLLHNYRIVLTFVTEMKQPTPTSVILKQSLKREISCNFKSTYTIHIFLIPV